MDFTELYTTYVSKIFRVCLGFVNDKDIANDLTQDTFISVWQNLNSFRNESAIDTWIFRIATNKCLRFIEKEKRQQKVDLPFQVEDQPDELVSDEKLHFLRSCIADLAEIDRIIISLFMEELSQEKIAEVTGLSHANVRVRVHRIKNSLSKKFKENGKF